MGGDVKKKAVVLLSGGLDSATVAAIADSRGFSVYALTVAYGQRHALEIRAAERIARAAGAARHLILPVDLRPIGGSALTDDIAVPKSRSAAEMGQGIPATYVPARNTIFLALAVAYAETLGSTDVFIGVNAVDFSGYPDCRPAFIEAFQRVARLGTRAADSSRATPGRAGQDGEGFRVHAPLMQMSKAEIIREGQRLGVDFAMTRSCYDPLDDDRACGRCDSCLLRKRGFEEAGLIDPIAYAE